MKRTLALTLLGIAAATTAYGQGDFLFSNYVAPYVAITYQGNPVPQAGVTASVWGAPGASVPAGALVLIGNAPWSSFAGYTEKSTVFRIPAATFVGGSTWTLQLRAEGVIGGTPVIGAGPLIVTSAIANQEVIPPEVATTIIRSPGFAMAVVPEPSTFALAGLGAAALLIFRRRA
jgi:hypothetical protein